MLLLKSLKTQQDTGTQVHNSAFVLNDDIIVDTVFRLPCDETTVIILIRPHTWKLSCWTLWTTAEDVTMEGDSVSPFTGPCKKQL